MFPVAQYSPRFPVVQACVDPNPHTAVNRTHAGFEAYEALMFIFGFPWGIVNLVVVGAYFASIREGPDSSYRPVWKNLVLFFFSAFVVVPIGIALIILPFFGGWIIVPIVQHVGRQLNPLSGRTHCLLATPQYTWNHRCDNYPMYAILDAKSYNDPQYVTNKAYFYEQGHSDTLFTYEIANPGDADIWTFSLRTWDSMQSSIPLPMYPTLQFVQYDFVNSTLTGNCTVPISPTNTNSSTISSICLNGTYDPGNVLSFDLTSSIPLNNTSNATAVPSLTTSLRSEDKQWSFSDDAPSLILRQVDATRNTLEEIVLRTAVTKQSDCTELKVCLAGTGVSPGSVVGAEVLAPLGLILMRQADYAIYCTTPSDTE